MDELSLPFSWPNLYRAGEKTPHLRQNKSGIVRTTYEELMGDREQKGKSYSAARERHGRLCSPTCHSVCERSCEVWRTNSKLFK